MAESAGLVLGAVALASMFSTCVELADYVNLGKTFPADHMRACARLDLLRTRLWEWGDSLDLLSPDHGLLGLGPEWVDEDRQVIGRSLRGIQDILETAGVIAQKYSTATLPLSNDHSSGSFLKTLSNTYSSAVGDSENNIASVTAVDSEPALGYKRNATRDAWSNFRRRISWAVYQKRRFDGFLVELEAFINSLERVTKRVKSRKCSSEPPYQQQLLHETMSQFTFHNIEQSAVLNGSGTDVRPPAQTTASPDSYTMENVRQSAVINASHDQRARDAHIEKWHEVNARSHAATSKGEGAGSKTAAPGAPSAGTAVPSSYNNPKAAIAWLPDHTANTSRAITKYDSGKPAPNDRERSTTVDQRQ